MVMINDVYCSSTRPFAGGAPLSGPVLREGAPFRGAERFLRESLAQGIAVFGPTHPNVAIRLMNLAEVLRSENRNAEARPLYEQALAILRGSLPEGHALTELAEIEAGEGN